MLFQDGVQEDGEEGENPDEKVNKPNQAFNMYSIVYQLTKGQIWLNEKIYGLSIYEALIHMSYELSLSKLNK